MVIIPPHVGIGYCSCATCVMMWACVKGSGKALADEGMCARKMDENFKWLFVCHESE